MKTLIKLPAMLLGLLLLIGTTQNAKAQYDDVSLQTFYDELSPYGTWINDPEYGYVWRPDVDQAEFRPYYTNGRWAMTEYGNTWVSNYEWGWAPFHYGRWMYNRYNNWVWLPDTTWGPAWVTWRSGGSHYGWAPLGPIINVNINIGRGYVMPDFCWNFIPSSHIYYNNYPRYYSGRNRVYIQNTVIINNTYVRNNRTYYTGPRADDIRRATNQRVTVYNVSRTNTRGGNRIENNNLNVYAPRPTRGVDNAKAAPRQVVSGNITRERIERSGNVTRDTRGRENGAYTANTVRPERNNNATVDNGNVTRERSANTNRTATPNRERRIDNGTNATTGSIFGRGRESGNATPNEQNGRNRERTMEAPAQQRSERSRESMPSRSSSDGGMQQKSPPQRSAERMERPASPQRAERVERPQSTQRVQPPASSGRGESPGRASRSESSGRPGRG